jgi:hypothetical protein
VAVARAFVASIVGVAEKSEDGGSEAAALEWCAVAVMRGTTVQRFREAVKYDRPASRPTD